MHPQLLAQALHDVLHHTHSNYLSFLPDLHDYQEIIDVQDKIKQRLKVPADELDQNDPIDKLIMNHGQTIYAHSETREVLGNDWSIQENICNTANRPQGKIVQLQLFYRENGQEGNTMYEMGEQEVDGLIRQLQ